MSKTLPLLPALLALSLGASPAFSASSATEPSLTASGNVTIIADQITHEQPTGAPQTLAVAQLQQRFDDEARNLRRTDSTAREVKSPVIRATLKIQSSQSIGEAPSATSLVASPTLVTQAGQVASITVDDVGIALTSSVDEQNNINSVLEFTLAATAGKEPAKPARVAINSRPGETASAKVGNLSVDLVANLVEPKGINVDFPGGTLAQLLDSLNTAGSRPFNLVATKEILALSLPAFKLRNVEPRDLALTIDWLLDGYIVDIPSDRPDRAGLPVFTVRVNTRSYQPSTAEQTAQRERFKSYPLAILGGRFPVEEVVATINAAWTLDPTHRAEALRLKYHAPTGILLVSSREETALEIVDTVMNSLVNEASSRPRQTP